MQYDVSTAHRRRALFAMFRQAEEDPSSGPTGVFVQIRDSPYRLASRFAPRGRAPFDDRGRWALEALAFLDARGLSEADWNVRAAESAGVATTLAPLGAKRCADLLEHAYFLTAANLHVLFGNGITGPAPSRERFERMAGMSA
ncbi:MAG: hypothetical protein R2705_08795 [Ilumatobacteraceae bacterium]